MELATLKLVVDANGAVQSVERLNTSLDKNVKVAKMSEAAALANGRTWQQMAGATATLNTSLGVTTRQMSGAAQKSLLLADALSRGSVSGATLSARLLGLGQTAGLVFGPAGIAFAAATGFIALLARMGDEAKEARKELEEFSRVTLANRDYGAAGSRVAQATGAIGVAQAEIDRIRSAGRRALPGGGFEIDISRADQLRIDALRKAIGLREQERVAAQKLVDILAPLEVEKSKNAASLERQAKAAKEAAEAAEKWAESLRKAAEFSASLARSMAWERNILNRNRGVARSVPGQPSTGDPLAPIGIGSGLSPHPFWRGIGKGDGPQADAFTEAFAENFSRAMGDAIGRAFTGQLSSGREFAGAISNVIGQAIAGRVSKGIAEQLAGVGTLGLGVIGGGIGILASAFDGFFDASKDLREAARELKASVQQSRQDVQRWAMRAGATPEQQALFGTQDTAAGFFRDLIDQLVENPEFGTVWEARQIRSRAQAQFGEFDFDEIESVWAMFKDISSVEDQARLQSILEAYGQVIAAQERSAALAAANAIGEYRRGMNLGQFSPLSPTAQLREARAEFERLRAEAMGGDTNAAGQLTGAASTLLGLSRQVNASGGRYVADFNTVSEQLRLVQEDMKTRASFEEESVLIGGRIVNNTQRTNEILGDGFTQVVDTLAILVAEVEELKKATKEGVALT